MSKNKLLVSALVLIFAFLGILLFNLNKKTPLVTSVAPKVSKEVAPSETQTQYSDPAGFTFSYPDNLSIAKKDFEDKSTYADLQLSSKDVNGSLSLKITDSKFASLDEWVKSSTKSESIKEVKLGNLKAWEIRLSDRLLLGALDQGILFTLEMPLVEEKFWSKVYQKVIAGFSFVAPQTSSNGDVSYEDVSFEGEEVVE